MCSISPDLAARLSAERHRKFVGRVAERDLFRSALAADEPPFNVLFYAVAFVVLQDELLSGLFLMLVGLLTSVALIAVYERLRETDASFALLALVLGIAGSLGSAVHGGYDLANVINPPTSMPDLPNPVDPRGLLTFGVAGAALFVVSWLIRRGGQFPGGLGYLGYLSAILLLALYLGRLIVFDPTSPVILVPALLNGFLINPIFYVWLGLALLRGRTVHEARTGAS